MLTKPRTNFPRDGHCNTPNRKDDKGEMVLSQHYSVFHGNVNKPPIHEAYTVTFVEQSNFHSLNVCEDLVLVSQSVSNALAEVWLPSIQNANLVHAFCRFSESYVMLFQDLIGHVALTVAAKFKCIYLRIMYSIVLLIATCVVIYFVHLTFSVCFQASLNAFSWVRRDFQF